jgi:hypothetical protein
VAHLVAAEQHRDAETVAPSGKWLPGSVSVVIMAVAVMA